MTHRAPDIDGWSYGPDGGLTVKWTVDTFFADSVSPDAVSVELNQLPYKPQEHLEPNGQITIPATDLAHYSGILGVEVLFGWTGEPPYVSSVSVPVGSARGGAGSRDLAPPILGVVSVEPQSLRHPNQITISWRSQFPFTADGGKGSWGPSDAPNQYSFVVKPAHMGLGVSYQGEFKTDQPLTANTIFHFSIQVKNSLGANKWVSADIGVRSARNISSTRRFLLDNGFSLPATVLTTLGTGSLSSKMGV